MAQLEPSALPRDATDFRKTWDTSYVPRRERFSYFREGICQAFLAASPEDPMSATFEARIGMAQLPRGLISKVSVTPHRVSRTKADLSKIDGEYLSLGLQVTGGLQGDLSGKPFTQGTGDVFLVHANKIRDWTLEKSEPYTTTGVLFHRSVLNEFPRLADLHRIDSLYRDSIIVCLSLMNERYDIASKAEMTHLFDAALSLLTASLNQDRDFLEDRCGADAVVRRGIVQTIQAFINREIANPALSTTFVADRFGISARYVQKLFAADGMTLKAFIVETRLTRVRADLLDQNVAHIPPSDIAFRWGFRDMTTFYRNFKLRFGHAPGQLRAMKSGGGSPFI